MVGIGGKDSRLEYGWNRREEYIVDWNMVGIGGKDSRLEYIWDRREAK